jgi:hypothetical protein
MSRVTTCQNPECGKLLEAKRSTKKYCDARCRVRANRILSPERTNQKRRAKWGKGSNTVKDEFTNAVLDTRPRIRVPRQISAGLRASFLLMPTRGKANGQKSYRFDPAPRSKLGDSRAADPLPRPILFQSPTTGRWNTPAQRILDLWRRGRNEDEKQGWIHAERRRGKQAVRTSKTFPVRWQHLERLSVTPPNREPGDMEPPTITERISKLEREYTRQRGEIDEVARQVGLRFDHEAVQDAVDEFLKDALD